MNVTSITIEYVGPHAGWDVTVRFDDGRTLSGFRDNLALALAYGGALSNG